MSDGLVVLNNLFSIGSQNLACATKDLGVI